MINEQIKEAKNEAKKAVKTAKIFFKGEDFNNRMKSLIKWHQDIIERFPDRKDIEGAAIKIFEQQIS